MTLILLPNTIEVDRAQLTVTDAADTATTDTAGLENVIGGPRSLAWSSNTTDTRRIVYVNKGGGLECTHVIVARMDQHTGKGFGLFTWSAYPASPTTEFTTAAFAETLVGVREQDWIYPLDVSGKHAVGIGFADTGYTKHVYKFYASTGITYTHHTAPSYQILPFPSRHQYRRQVYLIDGEWQFFVEQLTRAEVEAFEAIPELLSEPMFIYDEDGTSISYKLLHGIVSTYQISQPFDDLYQLSFSFRELRQWP